MRKLMISGNARPVIGQKEMYSVSFADENGHPHEHWLDPPGLLYENPLQAAGTHWEVMVKTGTGWRKGGSAKEGQTVPYTFGQKSLMHRGIKIVARQGEHTAELVVHPQRAKEPKLLKVELLDVNYRPLPKGKVLNYRDTVIARAYCVEMFNMQVAFTLWEDDARGPGHNPAVNALNKINHLPLLGIVNSRGVAEVVFRLPSYTMAVVIADARMAPGDRGEGAAHEYYVTADVVSRSIQKASPNVNVDNPIHHPDPPLQSSTPERKTARPPKVQPVPEKPKPHPDSPKFPVTTGGESRSDDREKLLHAGFVDAAGNRLHSSRVGSTAVMKITARNMNHKKVRVKVWEQDNLLWTHDLIYDSSWILTGDENYISLQLTKKMFDKARDGGTDSSRQDYFIEVIHHDTSVTSEVLAVSLNAAPAKAEKGRSVSVVDEPKVEKNVEKCPNCDKDITFQDLKTIFSNATIDKLKIVADTYNKYMKDLQMNTCWNKAHFFAQAKIESGSALSLKEGEGFNYYWKALIDTFSAFQTEEGKNKAKYWGRAIQNRKDPRAIDVSIETQKKIANYVYSPPAKKAIELGNTEPTDGWNYRGRGLIQVTGRSFYEYCNPYTLKYNNIDVVRNPDEVGTNLEIAVSSAMIFFKWKNINSLANITRDVIGKICPKVGNDIIKNGVSKNYQEKQDTFDNITSKIFKLNECKLKRFIESGNLTKLNKKGKYNIDAAVAYITNNSETKSLGKCAKYVRLAINAGGITNIYGHATEYYDTDKLVKYGFTKIGTDLNSIQLKKGDIVAFGSVKGHSYGHIAMWTGNEWISDFKQKSFWVANQYSVEKKYAIYRWEE